MFYARKRAFVSEIFLIVMMSFLSLCEAMNEYLYRKAAIGRQLEDYLDVFRKEALLIETLKCRVVRNEEMISYELPEGRVEISVTEKGCIASFQGVSMEFEIKDGMIVAASFLGV